MADKRVRRVGRTSISAERAEIQCAVNKTYDSLRTLLGESDKVLTTARDRVGARDVENCYLYDAVHRAIIYGDVFYQALGDLVVAVETIR